MVDIVADKNVEDHAREERLVITGDMLQVNMAANGMRQTKMVFSRGPQFTYAGSLPVKETSTSTTN